MRKIGIGMDIGSFNSASAVIEPSENQIDAEEVDVVPSKEGTTALERMYGKNFPSFICFDKDGNYIDAGLSAKRKWDDPDYIVLWGVKSAIGRSYDELFRQEVTWEGLPSYGGSSSSSSSSPEAETKIVPFLDRILLREVENANGGIDKIPYIKVGAKEYTPEEVYSFLIRKIKEETEHYLEEEYDMYYQIKEVTITVPADFNPNNREATIRAAKLAGIEKVDLITEPTAACISYGVETESEPLVIVFDMGAGTTDVTLGKVKKIDNKPLFNQINTKGDKSFGGLAIDTAFSQYINEKFQKENSTAYDLSQESGFMRKVEEAKIFLSNEDEMKFSMTYDTGKTWNTTITRLELENSIGSDVIEQFIAPLREVLNKETSGFGPKDIDEVLLVGGPVHMPLVREAIMREFSDNPKVLEKLEIFSWKRAVNPMECVVKGAAINSKLEGMSGTTNTPHEYVVIANRKRKNETQMGLGFEIFTVVPEGTPIPLDLNVMVPGFLKTFRIAELAYHHTSPKLDCVAYWDIPVDVDYDNNIDISFNISKNMTLSVAVDSDHESFDEPVVYENMMTTSLGPIDLVDMTRREINAFLHVYLSALENETFLPQFPLIKAQIDSWQWDILDGYYRQYQESKKILEMQMEKLDSLDEDSTGAEKMEEINKTLECFQDTFRKQSMVLGEFRVHGDVELRPEKGEGSNSTLEDKIKHDEETQKR